MQTILGELSAHVLLRKSVSNQLVELVVKRALLLAQVYRVRRFSP